MRDTLFSSGQALNAIETPFHEIGHFMDLQHTVNTDDCYTIANDGVDDTIEDHQGDGWGNWTKMI